MTTYTKETALYDTGKIAGDIQDAGAQVNKYISRIDDQGIKVHPYDVTHSQADEYNYAKIDSNGMEIWQKPTGASTSVKVAEFGANGAQIGQSTNTHIEINNNSLDIKEGTTTLSQFTSNMVSIGGAGTNARAYIGKNNFKMTRLYGDNNSLKYDLPYPFQDGVDADSIRPFQLYQHTITDNEGLYTHLPRRVKINLQAGQSKTVTFEPEISTGMIKWAGNNGVRILEAYDANGNTITTDGITAVQNQTTLAMTISIDNSYTDGTIDSILLALVGNDAYGCVICGNYHDFSNWDSIEWDPYWTRTNGWVPYPFVVGIGRRKRNAGKYYVDRKNGFTVDWDGNVTAAGEIHGALANPTISITASTGKLQSATVYKQGNVVQLLVSVKKTSATASGQEVFEGTINTTELRPKMITTSGTYYGSYALNATISTAGVITIRNADSRQLAAMTANGNISFTYLVD